MRFVAQELREYMAALGIKNVDGLIGRTDLLKVKEDRAKIVSIDLTEILDPAFAGERKEAPV